MSLKAERHPDSQGGFPAPEPIENQGSQEPKIDLADRLTFERVNEVTWKVTDGRGSLAWSGDRSGSHRTPRAVAWLMGVGRQLWVVRYRNKASRPMRLNQAKKYAVEMVRGIRPGVEVNDHVKRLNQLTAAAVDTSNKWIPPVEPALVEYIRHVETGRELEVHIAAGAAVHRHADGVEFHEDVMEFHDDGYPKIPALT